MEHIKSVLSSMLPQDKVDDDLIDYMVSLLSPSPRFSSSSSSSSVDDDFCRLLVDYDCASCLNEAKILASNINERLHQHNKNENKSKSKSKSKSNENDNDDNNDNNKSDLVKLVHSVRIIDNVSNDNRDAHKNINSEKDKEKEKEKGQVSFAYGDDNADNNDENDGDSDLDDNACLICFRIMPLTRHHLIPKTTHQRQFKMMKGNIKKERENNNNTNNNNSNSNSNKSKSKSKKVIKNNKSTQALDDDSSPVSDDDNANATSDADADADADAAVTRAVTRGLRSLLCRTISICRPCHSAIHEIFTEQEMAEKYNTLEMLMSDARVLSWAKYASKQRVSKTIQQGHKVNIKYAK